MDEYIDIWDAEGKPTGKIALKSEAHKNGWFHPTVHIWFYTRRGEVLLQKRVNHKETFPGMWDVSVAGHLGTGERPLNGALREIKEELGIDVDPKALTFTGIEKAIHHHEKEITDCEFHHVFLCELRTEMQHLKLQETEVADIKLVSKSILETGICTWNPKEELVPHGRSYYAKVFSALGAAL